MAELTGKIIAVLPLASGVSNRTGKEWASQDYVIEEQNARYPQRVCFKVFGSDNIQQFALQLGDIITVKLELGAREYNGKWYNEINCWSVERPMAVQQQQPQQPYVQPVQQSMPQQQQNYAPSGQQYQSAQLPQGYAQNPQQGDYQQQPMPPHQQDGGLPF